MTREFRDVLIYTGGALVAFGGFLWWKRKRTEEALLASPAASPEPWTAPSPLPQPKATPAPPPPAADDRIPMNAWGYRQDPLQPFEVFFDDGNHPDGVSIGKNYLVGIKNPYTLLVITLRLPKMANNIGDTSLIERAGPEVISTMQTMYDRKVASGAFS